MFVHKKSGSRRFKSIKSNQFSSFVLSFILPSLLMTLLLFAFFINHVNQSNNKEKINTLSLLSSRLTAEISSAVQMSLTYIYDEDICDFYKYLCHTDADENLITYNQLLQKYAKSVSKNITLLSKNILGIGFISEGHNTGSCFYLPKYKNMELLTLDEYTETSWYTHLKIYDTDLFFAVNHLQPNALSIIRAAKDIDRNQILGYIIVDISFDFISDLLDELSFDDYSGILLYSPAGEFLFSSGDLLENISDVFSPPGDSFTYNRVFYKIFDHTDQTYGFHLYYFSSRKDLYSDFFSAFILTLLFYTGIMSITCLIYLHYAREITTSITPILETMTKYNGGDPNSRCPDEHCRIKEFRMISENLNIMIKKINLHISNEYKLEIEKKNAEFKALQSEINPHFLYNTLNLFITLNRIGAKAELEKAIVSLSHLFRYTCEHKAESTVEKEFAFISDYLYLQQIRFDDRLTFEIYLEPGLEYFQIPKLLIQPLVENAVVHGLEPSDEIVHITILAVTAQTINRQQFTIISVVNTGAPLVRENSNAGRTGLKNIKDRLAIFYPDSLFSITGGAGLPTKCCIMIPTEKETNRS